MRLPHWLQKNLGKAILFLIGLDHLRQILGQKTAVLFSSMRSITGIIQRGSVKLERTATALSKSGPKMLKRNVVASDGDHS